MKSKYQKAESKAKLFYQKWKTTGSYSPAFKETIQITRFGWDHLVNPKKRRTKVEKVNRFDILPLARKLIETATTYQEHRYDKGIHYYALIAEIGGKRIKTILSSKGKGKKIFLSVIILR